MSIPNSSFNNSQLLNLKNQFYKKTSYLGFTNYLKKYLFNLITTLEKKKNNIICLYFSNSIFIEENEEIIQYLIDNKRIKILPTHSSIGYPGFSKINYKRFHKSLKLCKRFYPHSHNVQTTFLCKFFVRSR